MASHELDGKKWWYYLILRPAKLESVSDEKKWPSALKCTSAISSGSCQMSRTLVSSSKGHGIDSGWLIHTTMMAAMMMMMVVLVVCFKNSPIALPALSSPCYCTAAEPPVCTTSAQLGSFFSPGGCHTACYGIPRKYRFLLKARSKFLRFFFEVRFFLSIWAWRFACSSSTRAKLEWNFLSSQFTKRWR